MDLKPFYLLILLPLFAQAQTLYPFTSGVFGNTSVSTTSNIFSDVISFNFTNPIVTSVNCFDLTTILSSASGGSGLYSEYQVYSDGVAKGYTGRNIGNGETVNPIVLGGSFSVSGSGTSTITIKHRRASGTGTLATIRTSSVVFCMKDMTTGVELPFTNYTINTSFSSLTPAKLFSFNVTLDEPRRIVVFGTQHHTKTTTGIVNYYANITYSNNTFYVCPTITRYAPNGEHTGTGYNCMTQGNAPTGSTQIDVYAWNTAGSSLVDGQFNAFGYSGEADLEDGKFVRLQNINVTSTSLISVANATIKVASNQSNVYALVVYSSNSSVAPFNMTGVLSIYNSTSLKPVMTDENLYPSTFFINAANASAVVKQQRDFRNVTADNYTVHYNVSVGSGYGFASDGGLIVLKTDSVPNSILPVAPSFISPSNTSYYKAEGALMLASWTNGITLGGALLDYYNLSLFTSSGVFVKTLNASTDDLNYIWNFSTISNGQYQLRVQVVDLLGYSATGTSEFFTIGTSQPTPIPIISLDNERSTGFSLIFYVLIMALSIVFMLFGYDRRNAAFVVIGGVLLVFLGLATFSPITTQSVTDGYESANGTIILPQVTTLNVAPAEPYKQVLAIALVLIGLFAVFIVVDAMRDKKED